MGASSWQILQPRLACHPHGSWAIRAQKLAHLATASENSARTGRMFINSQSDPRVGVITTVIVLPVSKINKLGQRGLK